MSEHVEKEMKRPRKNILPQMPSYLFHDVPGGVKLLYINIENFNSKIDDIKNDHMFQDGNIISLNETHLGHSDTLTPHMMGIQTDMLTVHCGNCCCRDNSTNSYDCDISLQATINTN